MTSKERRLNRYKRRQAKRKMNRQKIARFCDNFDMVFTYSNLYKAYKKCCLGVGWKGSTQAYRLNAVYNVYLTYKQLKEDKFKSDGFFEFNIQERGKVRHIRSVKIEERVVQRCLCDNALTPMLGRRLIYDNGASTKGKGYTFTVNRLTKSLHQYYRKYGHVGYILLFDFSKFFDTLEHWLLHQIIKVTFEDERLIKLSCYFIDMFGEKGIGLGSQISQNMALSSASKLDHYIKEVLRIKGYARYMDDGYLIHHSKEYLHKCLFHIKKICNELGIILNEKKTHISRLDKGFTYIKIRFYLTPTGKIIKKIEPNSVTRMRRKLKKFAIFVKEGKMSKFDVYQSLQSWISHAEKFNAYRTIRSMVNLYYKLFGDEYVYKNYKKLTDSGCNEKRKSGVCKTEPKKQGNNNL